MKNQTFFLTLLALLLVFSLYGGDKRGSNKKVTKVIINSIETNSLTEYRIECDNFYDEFKSSIRNFVFVKQKDINRIMKLIKTPAIDSLTAYNIDTRAKLIVV